MISIDSAVIDGGGYDSGGGGGGFDPGSGGGSIGGGGVYTGGIGSVGIVGGGSIPGVPVAVNGGFVLPNKPYKKLSGITQGGNSLTAALNNIFASYQRGEISLDEALFEATTLQNYLGDSNVFYQAQHGKDASALQNFKNQAAGIISSISSWVNPNAKSTDRGIPTTQTPPWSPVTPAAAPTADTSLQDLLNAVNVAQPKQADDYGTLSTNSTASGGSAKTMIILVVVAAVAFFGYRYWKKHNG